MLPKHVPYQVRPYADDSVVVDDKFSGISDAVSFLSAL